MNLFAAVEAVYGATAKGTAPLPSADGTTLLTEKTQILHLLSEHVRDILDCLSTISGAAMVRLPQMGTDADLDLPIISTKPSGSYINSPAEKSPIRSDYR
ncbi:hypothetical protein SprV_0301095200 [Sparganum proliferum]